MSPTAQHRTIFCARVLTLLYTILICVLSLMPGDELPLNNISDKYRHAAAYGVFALLLGASFLRLRLWSVPLAFIVASVMGIAMEIVQPSFGRTRDPYDALANAIGAGIGATLLVAGITVIASRQPTQLQKPA